MSDGQKHPRARRRRIDLAGVGRTTAVDPTGEAPRFTALIWKVLRFQKGAELAHSWADDVTRGNEGDAGLFQIQNTSPFIISSHFRPLFGVLAPTRSRDSPVSRSRRSSLLPPALLRLAADGVPQREHTQPTRSLLICESSRTASPAVATQATPLTYNDVA